MLESLFTPSSVAVVGASRTPGKVGHEILANLIKGQFGGEIIPVNPVADEILGFSCVSHLRHYSGAIDLAIIAVTPGQVVEAVTDSIAAGTRTIAVLTAGLGESGTQGRTIQNQIQRLCNEAGVRLLGPNCLGIINTGHRLNASFAGSMPQSGGLSVLSQSGSLCTALLNWAQTRGLGLAKVVSIGNKADLDEIDFLEALARDEQTRVVVGYLENITSGERFVRAARTLASVKPFILFRAGVTQPGIWVASAHTGNLAGADSAYNAAFRRAGVIRAESLDALFDYAAAFSMQPLVRGECVAIVTNAGGPAVIAADAVAHAGLKLAQMKGPSLQRLREKLPPAASLYNPIDVLGDADPQRYADAVAATQQDEGVDATVVILTPHAMTQSAAIIKAIAGCDQGNKPILVSLLGATDTTVDSQQWIDSGLPRYSSPERAVAVLRSMWDYQRWRQQPARVVARFPVNRRRVERVISRHLKMNQTHVGEAETKDILKAYDFGVPEGGIANSPDEAVEIAERVGYPVALKILSLDIVHKSDVGGVKLGLSTAEQIRDIYDLLTLRVTRRVPEARLTGIYVEKMCGGGLHVVMGMTTDPRFGPMLMFGLGGTFVDRLDGQACYLAPITADEARSMLAETRSYARIKETRGQADADIEAVVKGLQRLSQLATDFPQIKELNINPYIVGPVGTEAMAVDARIVLVPPTNGRRNHGS